MVTFDQTIQAAINSINKWPDKKELEKVVIIRDVTGRIAFLLDSAGLIAKSKLDTLYEIIKKDLGPHFQGNIYCKKNSNNDLVKAMIVEIEKLCWEYDISGKIKWYILERAIAKKAWVECNKSQKPVWTYMEALEEKSPKVVTFYSFKGGMGRTTALAATALKLAEEGKNVLLIDTDIEAPGLASLFFNENDIQGGTVDYLLEAAVTSDMEKIDMSNIILQVSDPVLMDGMDGKIFIIPAGTVDKSYLQKLARIDYQDAIPGNMKKQLTRLVQNAVDVIAQICTIDYVFLDSRAGFHDMGGVITTQMPHGIVLFGKDSRQSWQGMQLVLGSISESQIEKPFIAMVDSTCGRDGIVSQEERNSFRNQAYTICCDSYYSDDEEQPGPEAIDEAHSPIFIPYQPILANGLQLFSDGAIATNEILQQVKKILLGECYREIEKRLLQWFDKEDSDCNG